MKLAPIVIASVAAVGAAFALTPTPASATWIFRCNSNGYLDLSPDGGGHWAGTRNACPGGIIMSNPNDTSLLNIRLANSRANKKDCLESGGRATTSGSELICIIPRATAERLSPRSGTAAPAGLAPSRSPGN